MASIYGPNHQLRVVYSDASDSGYGGYIIEHGNLVANGQWSEQEAKQSSTWRELQAVRLVLESFQTFLKNERVRSFSDNQNVISIIQYGSRKPHYRLRLLQFFQYVWQTTSEWNLNGYLGNRTS